MENINDMIKQINRLENNIRILKFRLSRKKIRKKTKKKSRNKSSGKCKYGKRKSCKKKPGPKTKRKRKRKRKTRI